MHPEIHPVSRFNSRQLAEIQDEESRWWRERYDWDYSASANIIAAVIDQGLVDGCVLVRHGTPLGYCIYVLDSTRAVLGAFFVLPGAADRRESHALLASTLAEIMRKPDVTRIEAQLPASDPDLLGEVLGGAGFSAYPRLYMARTLVGADRKETPMPATASEHELAPWGRHSIEPSAALLRDAYRGQTDERIHLQYSSYEGCHRFLSDLLRHPGCGMFDASISGAAFHHPTSRLSGFMIGSRISATSAHLPQIAVHPDYWGCGLGRWMMVRFVEMCASGGYARTTLNVTEANERAVRLYRALGFAETHRFDAFVLERSGGNS